MMGNDITHGLESRQVLMTAENFCPYHISEVV